MTETQLYWTGHRHSSLHGRAATLVEFAWNQPSGTCQTSTLWGVWEGCQQGGVSPGTGPCRTTSRKAAGCFGCCALRSPGTPCAAGAARKSQKKKTKRTWWPYNNIPCSPPPAVSVQHSTEKLNILPLRKEDPSKGSGPFSQSLQKGWLWSWEAGSCWRAQQLRNTGSHDSGVRHSRKIRLHTICFRAKC